MQKHLYRYDARSFGFKFEFPSSEGFGISRSVVLVFKSFSRYYVIRMFSSLQVFSCSMLLSWHEEVPHCIKEKPHV